MLRKAFQADWRDCSIIRTAIMPFLTAVRLSCIVFVDGGNWILLLVCPQEILPKVDR